MASTLDGATFAFAAGVETAAAPPLDLTLDEIIKLRKKPAAAKAGAAVRWRAAPARARDAAQPWRPVAFGSSLARACLQLALPHDAPGKRRAVVALSRRCALPRRARLGRRARRRW
jgi:hypothetical protein